jgi:hypothetical protein
MKPRLKKKRLLDASDQLPIKRFPVKTIFGSSDRSVAWVDNECRTRVSGRVCWLPFRVLSVLAEPLRLRHHKPFPAIDRSAGPVV